MDDQPSKPDQPTQPLNPLDDLSIYAPSPIFTGITAKTGRRELRTAILSRGVTIHAHPKSQSDALKAAVLGQSVETLPIRRKSPKRGGLSKKAWKKARQQARKEAQEAGSNGPAS